MSLSRIIKVEAWLFEAFVFQKMCHVFVVIGVDHTKLKAYLDRDRGIRRQKRTHFCISENNIDNFGYVWLLLVQSLKFHFCTNRLVPQYLHCTHRLVPQFLHCNHHYVENLGVSMKFYVHIVSQKYVHNCINKSQDFTQ